MFHSRNPLYRDPVGAVEEGTRVHFRITVPRDLHCSAARLLMHQDGGPDETLGMFWCGMNKGLCTRLMAMPVPPAR